MRNNDIPENPWINAAEKQQKLEYNSTREALKMPEYGRLVQDMVEYAMTIENDAERQNYAEAIVSVMMGLNPKMKDVPDFQHKIWDHLAYLSDYKLNINYPYPVEKATSPIKPQQLPYPKGYIRFRHYGRLIERAMGELEHTPAGPQRDELTRLIANRMKRNLADWKGDGVEDTKVARDITYYTDGAVQPNFESEPLIRITDNKFRTRKNKGLV